MKLIIKVLIMILVISMTAASFITCGSQMISNQALPERSALDVSNKGVKEFSLLMFSDWYKAGWQVVDRYIQNNSKSLGFIIEVEKIAGGGEGNQIMSTRFASGDIPDFVEYYRIKDCIGQLGGLKNFTPIDGAWTANYPDELINSPMFSKDGHVYAVPIDTIHLSGCFYNKKVFNELGLQVPNTWDELVAICEKIKAAGITPVYFTLKDSWTGDFVADDAMFQEYVKSSEDEVVSAINTGAIDISTDLPQLTEILTRSKQLLDNGYVNKTFLSDTYEMGQKELAEGRAAMIFNATWVVDEIAKKFPDKVDDIGAFLLPLGNANTNRTSVFSPFALFMTTGCNDRETGMKVIDFLTSVECAQRFADAQPGIWTNTAIKSRLYPAQQDLFHRMSEGKSYTFYNYKLNYWLAYDIAAYWSGKPIDQIIKDAKDGFVNSAKTAGDPHFK